MFQDIDSLNTHLEQRRRTYIENHLTEQPLPVIVGNNLVNIEASYVAINTLLFKVETPLEAVDTCFKIIHTLNVKYSVEAEVPWTFIQRYIYEIMSEHNKQYICVNSLIADIERQDTNSNCVDDNNVLLLS